ncbi:FAD-dependent monooxygenase [Actinomycetospora endophytica]|uniref:FAD-dependent monooxygenase n=1 Tax=Actinomycetospora endophytica TaxID=2291215 RepID=A0ABS8P264_9PSEU|nr:FAD-dependent monooxygenase [Actinomycetospora endophytica]MCD2192184.1 FAD-dependent monooxygenase [Actinomycetospora endophytica]
MLTVVVAGAGIAGCAVAVAVHRAGHRAVVLEARPGGAADVGAFLVLASSGVRALDELGALAEVDAVAGRLDGFVAQTSDGTVTVERPLGSGGPDYRYVRRAALCEALQRRVEELGIDLRRGARVVGTERHDGGVAALLDDGGRIEADLLIAADGLGSRRRAEVDPDGPPPRYAGQRVYYGRSPVTDVGRVHGFHSVNGGAAFGHIPTGSETWWFCRVTAPPLAPGATVGDHRADVLDHVDGIAARLVTATGVVVGVEARDLPFVSRWERDRVLLVGDAAHAASPASGQGGSTALEDGVVLGKALRDTGDVDAAVALFTRCRAGRTQANVVASARHTAGGDPVPDMPPGRALDERELAAQLAWASPLT